MVKIVSGQENRVAVKVTSLIDYTGFSATLEVKGIQKDIPDLSVKNPRIVFSAGEVDSFDGAAFGDLTVFDKNGEVHSVYKIYFSVVESSEDVQGFAPIRIVIVSSFKYDGYGEESDEELQKKIDTAVEKAMSESIDDKVVDVVDSIIDEKVDTAVAGIIDPKVEAAVDAVIDDKVEESVNAIFDSSDSDTIGGMINGLHDKVEDDIEPRLVVVEDDINDELRPRIEDIEETLAKKVSVDLEDSDDNIVFTKGYPELDESEA